MNGERIRIRGLVQGVGFRPFVYGLARRHGLSGWVMNDAEGVLLEVEGATLLPSALELILGERTCGGPARGLDVDLLQAHAATGCSAHGVGGTGDRPAPITDKEADAILQRMQEGVDKPKPKVLFEPGEVVRVIDGPFNDFSGVVEGVGITVTKADVGTTISFTVDPDKEAIQESLQEFVDLYNPTGQSVSLDGWTLSDNLGTWPFPDGLSIDPGALPPSGVRGRWRNAPGRGRYLSATRCRL